MDSFHIYATVQEVEAGFREMTDAEKEKCKKLIAEAGVMVDTIARASDTSAKKLVVCRMVRRAIVSSDAAPMGATQGSVAALGYSQSWTIGGGSSGELYIGKTEKALLGVGNKIGASNPFGGEADAARNHC